jgi:hypothetical protein
MNSDWVVVHTAPNLPIAEMIRDFLAAEGIGATIRPRGLSPYIAVDSVEVLAPYAQREEALSAIIAFLEELPGGDEG